MILIALAVIGFFVGRKTSLATTVRVGVGLALLVMVVVLAVGRYDGSLLSDSIVVIEFFMMAAIFETSGVFLVIVTVVAIGYVLAGYCVGAFVGRIVLSRQGNAE